MLQRRNDTVMGSISTVFSNRRLMLLGGVLAALCICWLLFFRTSSGGMFRTARVSRGNLQSSISATGTLQPEEVIDVGAQVAGLILSFGKDRSGREIDFNSEVDEGTVLAQIDESLYQTDVQQAQAQVLRSKADLLQFQAKLMQAEADWKRAQRAGASAALSETAFDSYRAAFDAAKANVAVGEAEIAQADSALARAKRNLDYCIIRSPVRGVIIDKRVNVGQTVVSSLNAPSLFLIARDLRRMEVWISVNEADVGNIHTGQHVTFTVDAFPGRTFQGTVAKIRLNASMTQNVVTYIVEVATDNSDGTLLPYLTANARFEVSNRQNVLLVPNLALRWTPSQQLLAGRELPPAAPGTGTLWRDEDGTPVPIRVKVGMSDGSLTEVEGEGVSEGMQVISGVEVAASEQQNATNPFTPQVGRSGSRRM